MEEAVQEGTVLKKKVAEIFINGKNAMAVLDTDKFERHTGGTFHGIFISAGRTKAGRREYMAPPNEGSPQLIILSIFSISVFLG